MFGINTIKNLVLSIFKDHIHKTADVITYEKNGIKAMKVDGFPTIIQAGSMTIMKLDGVATDERLRKISETDDDYNRMRLLDEQEK